MISRLKQLLERFNVQYEDYLKELQQKIANLIVEHEDRFDVMLGLKMYSSIEKPYYVYDGEKFVEGGK